MVNITYHALGCLFYTVGAVYYIVSVTLLVADRRNKQRE